MSKIIKVTDRVVSIGTDDGRIKDVRIEDLDFTPKVGDEVDVYESNNKVIVSKKVVVNENPNGININVNANQQPIYVGDKKAVNKLAYCLLALFLGSIGIHKFYAGKTGAGVAYLLFCWTFIPAIIALIEFIVALCQKKDVNGNIYV